ncbi:hypothetical protein FQZ97_752200 [compost metagenome]
MVGAAGRGCRPERGGQPHRAGASGGGPGQPAAGGQPLRDVRQAEARRRVVERGRVHQLRGRREHGWQAHRFRGHPVPGALRGPSQLLRHHRPGVQLPAGQHALQRGAHRRGRSRPAGRRQPAHGFAVRRVHRRRLVAGHAGRRPLQPAARGGRQGHGAQRRERWLREVRRWRHAEPGTRLVPRLRRQPDAPGRRRPDRRHDADRRRQRLEATESRRQGLQQRRHRQLAVAPGHGRQLRRRAGPAHGVVDQLRLVCRHDRGGRQVARLHRLRHAGRRRPARGRGRQRGPAGTARRQDRFVRRQPAQPGPGAGGGRHRPCAGRRQPEPDGRRRRARARGRCLQSAPQALRRGCRWRLRRRAQRGHRQPSGRRAAAGRHPRQPAPGLWALRAGAVAARDPRL